MSTGKTIGVVRFVCAMFLMIASTAAQGQMTVPTSHTGALTTPTTSLILGDDLADFQTWWSSPAAGHQLTWKNQINSRANQSTSGGVPGSFTTAYTDASIAKAAALRWAMTGNAADLTKAVNALKVLDVPGGTSITRPEAMTSYLLAYDFIRSAPISSGDRTTIESRLLSETNSLSSGTTDSNAKGKIGGTRALAGVLLANTSLLNQGLSDLQNHFNYSTTDDGWFTDSHGHYLNYTLPHISAFVRAYQQGPGVDLYPNLQPYMDMSLGLRLPDGRMPNVSNGLTSANGLFLFSQTTNAADAGDINWYLQQTPSNYDWGGQSNLYNNDWTPTNFFALYDASVAPTQPSMSPTFLTTGQSGVSVFRNDWSSGSDYLLMSPGVDSPPTVFIVEFPAFHSHNDTGEILVASGGKYMLVAPGYERTDLSNSPSGLDTQRADWHNVLLVDGDVGSSDEGRKTRPGDFVHTDRLDSTEYGNFKGVADFATLQMNYRNTDVRRSTAFANEDYFIVADVMDGSGSHTYGFNLVGRGTQTILTNSAGLMQVKWEYDGQQVIEHLISTHNMSLATASLDMHVTYNVFEETQRMTASISATDGQFLSIIETGSAGSPSALAITKLSGSATDHLSMKIINAGQGYEDLVISQPTSVLRSFDDMQTDARFAYVRQVAGELQSAMIARGTSLSHNAAAVFTSDQSITLSMLFAVDQIMGTIAADGFTPGTVVNFHGFDPFATVTLDGSPVSFTNLAGFSSFALPGSGELLITFAATAIPEPAGAALLLLGTALLTRRRI